MCELKFIVIIQVADVKRMNGLATDLQMFALQTLRIPLPGRHPPSPVPDEPAKLRYYHIYLVYFPLVIMQQLEIINQGNFCNITYDLCYNYKTKRRGFIGFRILPKENRIRSKGGGLLIP
jgi:hypothetical protein